jgi:hypothetical protein
MNGEDFACAQLHLADSAIEVKASPLIDRVVVQLNAICKSATFDFAIAVGRLIITSFYGGQLDVWRRRGQKHASFRKLAKHPDLPMSPSALYRSVAIYELAERMGISRERRLSTSHLRLVLPLPSADQERLLRTADAEGWSVSRLRDEIAAQPRAASSPRGGRKGRSPLRKTLHTLRGCLDDSDNLVGINESDADLSPESARSAAVLAARVRQACLKLETRLARCADGARTEPPPSIKASGG